MPLTNPILDVHNHGQSIWLDYIRRDMLESGELKRLVDSGEITGLTSNPSIFHKAISSGGMYDRALGSLLSNDPGADEETLYEALAVEDIRAAADILRPVFDATNRKDGYVSLEVSPKLAYDTQATVKEAGRLAGLVARANLLIKVPSTAEGLPAVTELLASGVSVNVTLLFSVRDVGAAAEAYLEGLERLRQSGGDLSRVASVASFFVSRIDVAVDRELPADSPLKGRIAIANCRMAYLRWREVFSSERFSALKKRGARVQRLLFGSTSTKTPEYRDTLYVDELIGPDTVNTVPPATLAAFRDHGRASESLTVNPEGAAIELEALAHAGVDLDEVTTQLKKDGVAAFAKSYASLLATLAARKERLTARLT